ARSIRLNLDIWYQRLDQWVKKRELVVHRNRDGRAICLSCTYWRGNNRRHDRARINQCWKTRTSRADDRGGIGVGEARPHGRRPRTLAGRVLHLSINKQRVAHLDNAQDDQKEHRDHKRKLNHTLRARASTWARDRSHYYPLLWTPPWYDTEGQVT